jgi:hypothetical protein
MEMNSIVWSWTQPYTAWQPLANPAQSQDEVIEQKLQTHNLNEVREVLARIMAL